MIKPIETIYKGRRFRSRLEARWAVYFDVVGIKWEYEKEGYNLGDGIFYLPDFWLPQASMWAEVKGRELTEIEIEKIKRLVNGTDYPCLVLVGPPEIKVYYATLPEEWEDGFLNDFALTNYHGYLDDENRFYSCPGSDEDCGFPDVIRGVLAARSARFEHGERG